MEDDAGANRPVHPALPDPMTATTATLYTVRQGAAWITLNRPEQRNALSAALVNELHAHLQAALADDAVRAIVLTGAGSAFCAGADLKSPPGQVVDGQQSVSLATVLALMQDCTKPVIGAINGAAFAGGLGLVGACDLVITVDEAPYSFSEVKIGVIPAVISVVCLPKLGPLHGMKLFLTGERFSGTEAVGYGLAHQAVPAAQLQATVDALVATLAAGGPIAVGECKKLVRRIPTLDRDTAFAEASEWSARMFRSPEAAEGMAAFREKRKPNWIKP
ncbi:enoyl-CoA hydratase [Rubrivivax pictus]|uniref:Enoyl-CoA hydratase n=2 Tax=Pseudaquabacterium pictum TaxID=2315236 RepID=A0A480ALX7_9BURK|nr:enoyl-CoA hydratase [Rubrivivax pictus]